MKIEAVIVCDNYADFLVETLPFNRSIFDRLVVVTSHEDKHTRKACEYYHVQCIATDSLESRKGVFRKGAGINEGLAALAKDGWVVHLDADIALPPLTRQIIEQANLDNRMVYGIDRYMVKSYHDWHQFRAMPKLQHENGAWVHLNSFNLGTRVTSPTYGGWIPIGFFQMWNPFISGVAAYPTEHTSAGRGDMLFAANWPRSRRSFIPELVAYHLESEAAEMGANWNGRATRKFAIPD